MHKDYGNATTHRESPGCYIRLETDAETEESIYNESERDDSNSDDIDASVDGCYGNNDSASPDSDMEAFSARSRDGDDTSSSIIARGDEVREQRLWEEGLESGDTTLWVAEPLPWQGRASTHSSGSDMYSPVYTHKLA